MTSNEFEQIFKEYCNKTNTHVRVISSIYRVKEDRDKGIFARKHFTCKYSSAPMSCDFNLKISHLKKQNVYKVRSSTLAHNHIETTNNVLERAIEAAISDNIEPESSATVENFVEEFVNECQKLENDSQLQMHFDEDDTMPDSTADIEDGAFNQPGGVESDSPKTAKEETDTDSIPYLESRLREGQIFTSTHEFEALFKEYCAKTYTHFKILSAHYDRLSQEDRDKGLFARSGH